METNGAQINMQKILPIVKNQHLLLGTLLICNAMAMETLPIFLDALLPAWDAILISVTLILAFGERYGLSIGARLAPLVRLLVIVVFPLSYPISRERRGVEPRETTIIAGALDLAQKSVKDAMTPMSRIFSLDLHSKLTDEMMNLMISKGLSRVPVYSGTPTNIVGLILFEKGHNHMAVVVKSRRITKKTVENTTTKHDIIKINILPASPIQQRHAAEKGEEAIGIITMEDVLEQLLQEPIYDETDDYVDVHNKIRINIPPSVIFSPRRSPGAVATWATNHKPKWQSPIASPVHSSAHQSPMLRSPISPYVQPPYIVPKLSPAHLNSTILQADFRAALHHLMIRYL
ncbi:hypothetical protein MTR67_014027 [Solanum verrucosum]|uniref:CNNM transmembrane domain-containing protein n=1 Tax=Solanum verrucosum TaxID=315347 RepID=A0AAF0QD10_SOLVR|nr:hypothetical protein MTR67_014027 [Solanum verrucosum]